MKTRLFLSVSNKPADVILETAANVVASMRIVANLYPMASSVRNNTKGTYGVETGVRMDVLSQIDRDTVLLLWRRLRDLIGVHCVWLDYAGRPADGDDFEYSGCVCDWIYYQEHFDHIGDAMPMSCSEY